MDQKGFLVWTAAEGLSKYKVEFRCCRVLQVQDDSNAAALMSQRELVPCERFSAKGQLKFQRIPEIVISDESSLCLASQQRRF